jgi:hypothetical protein
MKCGALGGFGSLILDFKLASNSTMHEKQESVSLDVDQIAAGKVAAPLRA